jgi:hypothetical protein
VETIIAPNIDLVRRGVLIGSATKLGSELGGVLIRRNLSQSSVLPIISTKVVGILQMVFTNMIITIHVNMIADRPLMSSMVAKGYKNADVLHPRGRYQKPFVITALIFITKMAIMLSQR